MLNNAAVRRLDFLTFFIGKVVHDRYLERENPMFVIH